MTTLSAGASAQVYVPLDGTITVTPGSGGHVDFGCAVLASQTTVAPRKVYIAQTITIPAGSTVFLRAVGVDATYTTSTDSGSGTGNELSASTIANLPSASANSSKFLFCTDYGPAGTYLRSNGTRWKPFGGVALIHSTVNATAISGTSEQKAAGFALPPGGLLRAGDRLRMRISVTKSGTTDSGTLGLSLGTNADGVSNTDLVTPTAYLAASNISAGSLVDIRFESNTSTLKLGAASVFATSLSGASNSAAPAAVTIDDITAATQLYLSLTMLMGGTTNSMTLVDWTVELHCGSL